MFSARDWRDTLPIAKPRQDGLDPSAEQPGGRSWSRRSAARLHLDLVCVDVGGAQLESRVARLDRLPSGRQSDGVG